MLNELPFKILNLIFNLLLQYFCLLPISMGLDLTFQFDWLTEYKNETVLVS